MAPLLVTMGGAREHFWQPPGGILAAKVHSLGHLGSLLTHWGTVLLQKLGFACHGEGFALVERPFDSKTCDFWLPACAGPHKMDPKLDSFSDSVKTRLTLLA